MKACVWKGPHDVRIEEVPEPSLINDTDAIMKVQTAAICGTDLHAYHGQVPGFESGIVMGHEFMGTVKQVGSKVSTIHAGDRVIASDITACGSCWYCRQGLHWNCASRSLFGYGPAFGESLAGGQAEYVRIPHADTVLIPVPSDLADDRVLFLGDILSTGFLCALNGGVKPGDVVAVIGSGPVGVLTQMSARVQGAAKVFAIDRLPDRLAMAEKFGSVPINFEEQDPKTVVDAATQGRGADVALEAVGGKEPLDSALRVVRPHGTVSIVGVHLEDNYPFSAIDGFVRELTVRFGVGDPMRLASQILPLIENEVIHPDKIITHRLGLDDVPEGYRLFNDRKAFKVLVNESWSFIEMIRQGGYRDASGVTGNGINSPLKWPPLFHCLRNSPASGISSWCPNPEKNRPEAFLYYFRVTLISHWAPLLSQQSILCRDALKTMALSVAARRERA